MLCIFNCSQIIANQTPDSYLPSNNRFSKILKEQLQTMEASCGDVVEYKLRSRAQNRACNINACIAVNKHND